VTAAGGALERVLERARRRGFLGPGPIAAHVEHARALAAVVGSAPSTFVDLGSGGGCPALVLAFEWPESRGLLVEAGVRRAAFLTTAIDELGLGPRIGVGGGRAEDLARDPTLRSQFDLVVARSFGGPAVTAECAVGFLRLGGVLVVSDPPSFSPARWPAPAVAELGLGPPRSVRGEIAGFTRFAKVRDDDRWPRRAGIPAKRPRWKSQE